MRRDHERGQVLVIVSFAFVALLGMLALLFDAAHGLWIHRQMQDAGDAAALAAANVMHVGSPGGCSASGNTTPRATLVNAAHASLVTNLPWYDATTAVISCPAGHDNRAVAVDLAADAPTFFGDIFDGELHATTRSTAINGQIVETGYSVVILDPHNPSWSAGRDGCPAMRVSGNPTIHFEGSVQVNSACLEASGGALGTDGSQATITMAAGKTVRVVGEVRDEHFLFNPAQVQEGVSPIGDPLAGLPPVDVSALPVRSTSQMSITASTVLQPGVYSGGLRIQGSATVLLRPGIYVMDGGGMQVSGSAMVFSVNDGVTSSTLASWSSDCTAGNCGVLIYNREGTTTAMGAVKAAGGTTLKLRPYEPDATAGGGIADYENMLLWQDAAPVPTSSYAQPTIDMHGHGANFLLGTVYAPSALVRMGGGSEGTGGAAVTQRLQFIAWDLWLHGSPSFTFFYQDGSFTRPTEYGLIE
jgi:hypothetical protein